MHFYVFKMAVAIAFLYENAVEAIQISSISMILIKNREKFADVLNGWSQGWFLSRGCKG